MGLKNINKKIVEEIDPETNQVISIFRAGRKNNGSTPQSSKAERAKRRKQRRSTCKVIQMLPDATPRPDESCPEWQALKQRVREEEPSCRECHSPFGLTVDHIVPLAYGGGNHRSNLQSLCYRCNKAKGSQLPAPAPDFFPHMRIAA